MKDWYTDDEGRKRHIKNPIGKPYDNPPMEIMEIRNVLLLSDMVKTLEGSIDSLERSAEQHGSLFVGDLNTIQKILSDARHLAEHQHNDSALQELKELDSRVNKAIEVYGKEKEIPLEKPNPNYDYGDANYGYQVYPEDHK